MDADCDAIVSAAACGIGKRTLVERLSQYNFEPVPPAGARRI
jgi:hypothetical protein